MTGGTILIKLNDAFYLTKAAHDGYDLEGYLPKFRKWVGQAVSPQDIAKKYFKLRGGGDFEPYDPIKDIGICMFSKTFKAKTSFDEALTLMEDELNTAFDVSNCSSDKYDEDHPYNQLGCSYSDYCLFIDLNKGTLELNGKDVTTNGVGTATFDSPLSSKLSSGTFGFLSHRLKSLSEEAEKLDKLMCESKDQEDFDKKEKEFISDLSCTTSQLINNLQSAMESAKDHTATIFNAYWLKQTIHDTSKYFLSIDGAQEQPTVSNTLSNINILLEKDGQLVLLDGFDPSNSDDEKFFKPFKEHCKRLRIRSEKRIEKEAKKFAEDNNYPEPDQFINYYNEWILGI